LTDAAWACEFEDVRDGSDGAELAGTATPRFARRGVARAASARALVVLAASGCGPTEHRAPCEAGRLDTIVVRSEAEADALRRVDEISELSIDGSDLNDLHAFECLVRVGSLRIEHNPDLTSLAGMEQLEEVAGQLENDDPRSFDGELVVRANPRLVSIDAFASLAVVDGTVEVAENQTLTSVAGFDALQRVTSDLAFSANAQLEVIEGFDSYTGGDRYKEGAGGGLIVDRNPVLQRVSLGAPPVELGRIDVVDNASLHTIDVAYLCTPAYFNFVDNPELRKLPTSVPMAVSSGGWLCQHDVDVYTYAVSGMSGLTDLTSLPAYSGSNELAITNNANLRSLRGLNDARGVGTLRVEGNPVLESLRDLDPTLEGSLGLVGQKLILRNNPALDLCALEALVDALVDADPDVEVDVDEAEDACG
jgi:hypothetical protein